MLAARIILLLAASPLLVSALVLQEGGVLAYHDAAAKSSSSLYSDKEKKPVKSKKAYVEGTDAADGNTDKTKEEEQESDRIEKECEEQMKTKLNAVDSNDDDERNVQQEYEKDCFFQCLFQKHASADEKGNVVEKNIIVFFLKNSPFKDKAKLTKITGECIKKAKDEGKVKESDVCNPFSNYVYHCIYEDMHMEL